MNGMSTFTGKTTNKNGNQEWFLNGKRHRIDGPALISARNEKYWFINGYMMGYKFHQWLSDMNIDVENITDYDKSLIMMKFGSN